MIGLTELTSVPRLNLDATNRSYYDICASVLSRLLKIKNVMHGWHTFYRYKDHLNIQLISNRTNFIVSNLCSLWEITCTAHVLLTQRPLCTGAFTERCTSTGKTLRTVKTYTWESYRPITPILRCFQLANNHELIKIHNAQITSVHKVRLTWFT